MLIRALLAGQTVTVKGEQVRFTDGRLDVRAPRADVPAGDTYSGAGMYDATPSNIGLYAAVAVALLLLAAGAVWVFFG